MSFRRKLFLIIFSIGLLAFLIPSISMFVIARQRITSNTIKKLESILEFKLQLIQNQESRLSYETALIGSRTALKMRLQDFNRTLDKDYLEQINQDIVEAKQAVDNILEINILNMDGELIASTMSSIREGKHRHDFQTQIKMVNQKQFILQLDGDTLLHIQTRIPLMIMHTQVGYLSICYKDTYLKKLADDYAGLGRTGYLMFGFQLSDDTVLISGRRSEEGPKSWQILEKADLGQISQSATSEVDGNFSDILDWKNDHYLAATKYYEPLGMFVSVRAARSEVFRELEVLQNIMILVLIISGILILWIAFCFSKHITKPITELTLVTKNIKAGDYSKKAEVRSSDEVGQLAEAFNLMVSQINRSHRETLEEGQRAQQYLDIASVGMIALNIAGDIILINPYFEKILGYQTGELIGKNWFNTCIPERLRAKVLHVFHTIMTGNQTLVEYYHNSVITKSGEERLIAFHNSAITNEKAEIIGLLSSGSDITEIKQAEEALQESEEKYRLIVENANDGIEITQNDKIIFTNTRFAEMLGYTTEAMLNLHFEKLFTEQATRDLFERQKQRNRGKAAATSYETTFKKKNGEIIDVDIKYQAIDYQDKPATFAIIRDITQHKQAVKQIEQALINAKKANDVKDQFIANISHEIRTPLTSINGFISLLKRSRGEKLPDEEKDFFKFIDRSSDRLLRTVDSILNVSQLEAGTMQLTPRIIYLGEFTQAICEELSPGADEKGLEFSFSSSTREDQIKLDEYSLSQAIFNIIHNAIKFTNQGGVSVQLKRERGALVLSVSDTGIGIAEEYITHIFQPFSQESEGFTKAYQGIGLGLAVTKRYLDLNNVVLKVKSEKGQGSTFTLIFPTETGGQNG